MFFDAFNVMTHNLSTNHIHEQVFKLQFMAMFSVALKYLIEQKYTLAYGDKNKFDSHQNRSGHVVFSIA